MKRPVHVYELYLSQDYDRGDRVPLEGGPGQGTHTGRQSGPDNSLTFNFWTL